MLDISKDVKAMIFFKNLVCNACDFILFILHFQISEKAITTLKGIKMDGNNVRSSFSWKIEEAKVFWFQGEQETAMRQLKQINFGLKVRYVDLMYVAVIIPMMIFMSEEYVSFFPEIFQTLH